MNTIDNLLELGIVSTDTHSGGQDIDDTGVAERDFAAPAI